MSSEMRECPFCGNGAWVVRVPDTRRFRPQCKKCGADLGEFDREADAVAAWNRRTLLTRTEAGADWDKTGWQDGWPMAYHTRYRHVLEETIGQPFGEGTRLGSADIRRVAMAMAREFGVPTDTHPQDASGDAEIARLRRCVGFFASVIKSGEPWTSHCQVEYETAMQAKEAK